MKTLPWFFLCACSQILTAGVSVFPQDPSVEAAGVDSQFFSHQEAEAGRVQVGAAADDAVLGEAAQFPGHIGQHIHCRKQLLATRHKRRRAKKCVWGGTWVRNHNDGAVGAESDDLRDNVLKYVDISLDEVQPALALLLTDSRCHHHDAGVCCHRVIWRRRRKCEFVVVVKRVPALSFRFQFNP